MGLKYTIQASKPTQTGQTAGGTPGAQISRAHLGICVPLTVLVLVLVFDEPLREISFVSQTRFLVVGFATVAAWIIWQAPEGVASPTAVYLGTYGIFHFGMLAIVALYPNAETLPIVQSDAYWLCSDAGRYAANLVLMGACGFGLAVGFMSLVWPQKQARPRNVSPVVRQIFLYAGLILMGVFVGIFYMQILQWGVIGATYTEYRRAHAEMAINTYSGIAMGLVFLLAAGPSRWQRVGLGIFLIGWSPLAFVMGLRGEVLWPMATAFMLYARRLSKRISFIKVALAVVVLLMLVSAVKVVRHIGLQRITQVETDVPFDLVAGLGELGGSLAPVEATVRWIESGDPLLMGSGYWAAFDHELLPKLFPGYSPPDIARDPRVPVFSKKYVPGSGWHAFGFSMVATAYYNFGTVGVIFIMFITGCIISALGHLPVTPYYQALCGAIFYPLLVHVRSFFTNVPKRIALAILLVLITNVVSHIVARRKQSLQERAQERGRDATSHLSD